MGKYKENAKYNVVSMRVSEEEKLALEELMRKSSKTISGLMREAIQLYTPQLVTGVEQSQLK
jgi:predicted DNA-binding protein